MKKSGVPSRNGRQEKRKKASSSTAPGRAAVARAVERTTAVALPGADEGDIADVTTLDAASVDAADGDGDAADGDAHGGATGDGDGDADAAAIAANAEAETAIVHDGHLLPGSDDEQVQIPDGHYSCTVCQEVLAPPAMKILACGHPLCVTCKCSMYESTLNRCCPLCRHPFNVAYPLPVPRNLENLEFDYVDLTTAASAARTGRGVAAATTTGTATARRGTAARGRGAAATGGRGGTSAGRNSGRGSGRRNGMPNIDREGVMFLVEELLPASSLEWEELTERYQIERGEVPGTRSGEDMKNLFYRKMAQNGKKPTGTHTLDAMTRRCQQIMKSIAENNAALDVGDHSDDNSSDGEYPDDEAATTVNGVMPSSTSYGTAGVQLLEQASAARSNSRIPRSSEKSKNSRPYLSFSSVVLGKRTAQS